MGNTTIKNSGGNNTNGTKDVEVLYQKMGDRWFAFSMIGDEVFMGSLSQEEIDAAEALEKARSLAQRRAPELGGHA